MAKKATLLDQQEKVVRDLQDRLLKAPANAPPDWIKNLAIALGIAVDKFVALRPVKRAPFQTWTSGASSETATPLRERREAS